MTVFSATKKTSVRSERLILKSWQLVTGPHFTKACIAHRPADGGCDTLEWAFSLR